MQFFDFSTERYAQIIATLIVILIFVLIKRFSDTIIQKFGAKSNLPKARTQLVKKYIDILLGALLFVVLVSIWGVKPDQIFLFISSVLTVIGVAFFAQWSILSNVTAGIIVFFSFPFKIGDKIRILDNEFPIEAEIKDISSFYTLLITTDGEKISLPNNLLLQKAIVII
jgi:hypothetical protein|nr:mechanosensitive ion channel family protein [uncultured Capnocytophaga sp.]